MQVFVGPVFGFHVFLGECPPNAGKAVRLPPGSGLKPTYWQLGGNEGKGSRDHYKGYTKIPLGIHSCLPPPTTSKLAQTPNPKP